MPKISVLFKEKKSKDFDKPYRQCVFGVKNLVLKKYPKVLILEFWYNVGLCLCTLQKAHDFDK